jgi:hypothetical protein
VESHGAGLPARFAGASGRGLTGFIIGEFFELAGKAERDHAEEARLDEMKAQLAQRILAVCAGDVYELASLSEITDRKSKSVAAERDLIAVKCAGKRSPMRKKCFCQHQYPIEKSLKV